MQSKPALAERGERLGAGRDRRGRTTSPLPISSTMLLALDVVVLDDQQARLTLRSMNPVSA